MRANFYTLDFKKKIFLCLFLVVFAMVGLDVVLYVFAESRTSKTNFVDNKISKAEHFKINSEKQKDIVLLEAVGRLIIFQQTFLKKIILVFIILAFLEIL
ncbi:hypothetical protein [Campylobacter concisus]|uniref:hypothetical protein n=1 Tax=Campylobacter concisus TaxID=199 RepID=UPI000CD7EC50|nr:hypothetical protein [Campylobacter concisus]